MLSFSAFYTHQIHNSWTIPTRNKIVYAECHLDPGDRLLGLHHPGGLGGLALAHQLGGAKVPGSEEDAFYQHFRVSDGT